MELIKRLIHALDKHHLEPDDQSTPRRCYAKFLQQLLTARISSDQDSQSSGESQLPSPKTPEQALPIPANIPTIDVVKSTDFMLNPPDMSFLNSWDMVQPPQDPAALNTMLSFSETEYMQTFMAFPDQTWFMQ